MRKKVIIIEGPDNCGKDTLIKKLNEYFNGSTAVLHAGIPDSSLSLFDFYYNGLIHQTLDHYYFTDVKAIIHNRSIYGEYVYGPKYRNENIDQVKKIIYNMEVGELKTYIFDLYFILLNSDSVDLLVKNDDGLSYSSKKGDIEDEIKAFDDVFEQSTIKNKKRILVNNGNSFRSKEDIFKDVFEFIK